VDSGHGVFFDVAIAEGLYKAHSKAKSELPEAKVLRNFCNIYNF
jgi:hypothetical protein